MSDPIHMTVVVKRVNNTGSANDQGKTTTILLTVPEDQEHLAAKVFVLTNKRVNIAIEEDTP